MKIHFLCPKCEQTAGVAFEKNSTDLICPHCGHNSPMPADALEGDKMVRCLVCPSEELFVRKDFPQQLGLAIIVFGFALSSIAWYFYLVYVAYGILFATALVDAALYLWMGNVVTCYRCHAEYRGVSEENSYSPFDLEIHERYRQQAARLAEAASTSVAVEGESPIIGGAASHAGLHAPDKKTATGPGDSG